MKKMTEYITKEQAELIVESALREYIRTGAVETAFEKLYSLPDADVVEVVRCENCKHMRTISGEGWGIDTELYYCGENEILVSPVGYCSDGKRRNGGRKR